ncbi:MAG TPA: 2'-5' RNA ligase family protein [Puia sp.]|nr:2'-5' RNA ligase family protein [Puia sp.]
MTLIEYMLILRPHDELRARIMQVKKEFAEQYQAPQANWIKPHVLLARFTQYKMAEERILNRLRHVAMGFRPFKAELKDFGSYPSHTLFIPLISQEPVRALLKQMKSFRQLLTIDKDHKPYFTDEPQVMIANKLLPWQYEKGWLEYSHRHFTGRFIAGGMLLLEREEGEKAWQIREALEFKGLAVDTVQGDLF